MNKSDLNRTQLNRQRLLSTLKKYKKEYECDYAPLTDGAVYDLDCIIQEAGFAGEFYYPLTHALLENDINQAEVYKDLISDDMADKRDLTKDSEQMMLLNLNNDVYVRYNGGVYYVQDLDYFSGLIGEYINYLSNGDKYFY